MMAALPSNGRMGDSLNNNVCVFVMPDYEYEASSFLTSQDHADVLGGGGFGVVRRCRHSRLGSIAVKCLSFSEGSLDKKVKE